MSIIIQPSRLARYLLPALLLSPLLAGADSARYHLSLGTSLAAGVQPDDTGVNQVTDDGYADRIADALGAVEPKLTLVKLGCPGETTTSLIVGGICSYPHGSQLREAERFLHAHKENVSLVTIDIGVNDLLGCVSGMEVDIACALDAITTVAENLTYALTVLDASTGTSVEIIGMSYYNPFLAAWLAGPEGQAFAVQSSELAAAFNGTLGLVYSQLGVPVADVAGAFRSQDFTTMVLLPGVGQVPLNVALVCERTWMCVPPPRGPNIHPNAAGYQAIADAFLAVR